MREGWLKLNLIEVCEEITDGSHFSPDSSSYDKYPYITVKDVKGEAIDFDNCKFIDEDNYKQLLKNGCKPNNGDVLFSKDGTVGKVVLVDYEKQFVVLSSLAILRPKSDIINSALLKYILHHPDFLKAAIGKKTGVAIRRIILKNLKQIQIQFPKSLSEQKQIVAILDQAFAAIDRAKANIEKNIANAKALFQSKLNEIYSQKGEGWEEKTIEEISNVVNGYSFKSRDFSPTHEVKSIKITNVGIMEFVEDLSNNLPANFLHEYSKVKVHEGDLVLALTRTIISGGLKVARVPESYHNSLLNQRVAAIVPNTDLVDSNYLYYYFSSEIVYNYVLDNVNTLMQPNLSIGDLKKMSVPITSIEDQRKISVKIENLSDKTISMIDNYRVKINDLEELKKSILQKAFAGELTSPERATYTNDGRSPSNGRSPSDSHA